MRSSSLMRGFLTPLLVTLGVPSLAFGQLMTVEIIDRQTSDTAYSYTLPGSVYGSGTSLANCNTVGSVTNCYGAGTSQATVVPPRTTSYSVTGATFALRLPDGRVAIVNCASKYALRGDFINRRSCRVPLVNQIRAEFNKDNAKLIWPVSVDGRTLQSETYKILGVLPPALDGGRETNAIERSADTDAIAAPETLLAAPLTTPTVPAPASPAVYVGNAKIAARYAGVVAEGDGAATLVEVENMESLPVEGLTVKVWYYDAKGSTFLASGESTYPGLLLPGRREVIRIRHAYSQLMADNPRWSFSQAHGSVTPAKLELSREEQECEQEAQRLSKQSGDSLASRIRGAHPRTYSNLLSDAQLEESFLRKYPCLAR